ncbi:mechanosensitive ion channel family protein [Diplocloster agilis]|uniref:mechanosensitive ion channel family protein n=1 Tax=Diplocloster agilis TaxID=2850323 RepID=UPI001EE7ED78|nr:mechanosensitive ion channel family protein [Diplocloster agilis]
MYLIALLTNGMEELSDLKDLQPEDVNRLVKYVKDSIPGLIDFGIKIIIALALFFIGTRLIKLVQKLICKAMERHGSEVGAIQFVGSFVKAGLYFLLIFILAGYLGADTASIVALVGSAGLAIGLAVQGSLANFAGGVLILLLRPFKVGDYIIEGTYEGTVDKIELFYTRLLTVDNRMVIIPNGILSNNSLTNVTAQEKRQIDIRVGIAYDSDLKKAKDLLQKIMDQDDCVLKEEDTKVFVDSLADSCVQLGLRCWVTTNDYWPTRWRMTETIKLTFDENHIEIPFNQLDVNIKENAVVNKAK